MADKYDPFPDLGKLLKAAFMGGGDGAPWAERIAEQLGLGEDDSTETFAAELRKALRIPAPCSVVYDMADKDTRNVLTGALEMLAADQRARARAEGRNPRRHEWADLADRMMHQADTAWAAEAAGGA